MVELQWNIYMVNLNPVIGSEQAGARPAVVVSEEGFNQALPVITILPITSYKKGRRIYPSEVLLSMDDTGLTKDSIVMAHQIRTISKKRLGSLCGEIWEDKKKSDIREAIKTYLDLLVW